MSKIEKEYKVLDIDEKLVKKKLKELGAEYKGEKKQKIYVYDIPTIYHRYLEIKELLKSSNKLLINTNLKKLEILLIEYIDIARTEDISKIEKKYQLENLLDILKLDIKNIRKILNDKDLKTSIKNMEINPNKWIRLRQSNKKTELTCKHIIEKVNKNYQNVHEVEFEVSNFEEANLFLESIGICRRSYQEKIRSSYIYKDAEIEIDKWPMLETYLEIESDNDKTIKEIIDKLNLNDKRIVSLNTEQLYKEKGIDIYSISELKF